MYEFKKVNDIMKKVKQKETGDGKIIIEAPAGRIIAALDGFLQSEEAAIFFFVMLESIAEDYPDEMEQTADTLEYYLQGFREGK